MADLDVAAQAADDDFDVSADLAAAFDAAEAADVPAEKPAQETAPEAADHVRDDKGRFAKNEAEIAEKKLDKLAPNLSQLKSSTKAEIVAKAKQLAADAGVVVDIEGYDDYLAAAKAALASGIQPQQAQQQAIASEAASEQPAASLRPPPGWSPAAKVAFAALPPEVQQSVAKREQEVNQGFAKLAEYKPIERFAEMAKQSGTTLDRALENYVGMENRLRQDFPAGITELCQRQGINPVALANQILARNGVAPSEGQAGDTQGARQQVPSVDLSPIHQELNALKSYVQQQQTAGVQSEIESFASDPKHTFFDNVKADMGRLLNSGYATDLKDAYEKACWANPEIRPLLIKQQSTVSDPSAKVAAATQARAASKSITGAPIPNASVKGPETSIEDEIRQLMDASV